MKKAADDDKKKSKDQLVRELVRLRQRIAQVENSENEGKEVRKKALKERRFFYEIMESIRDPFYVIDIKDHAVVFANSATGGDGFKRGIKCYTLTHRYKKPCSLEGERCPIEEVRRTRKPTVIEHVHYNKKGEPVPVEIHAFPLLNSKGEVAQIIEYTVDITKRKAEDARIRELHESIQREKRKLDEVLGIDQKIGSIMDINQLVDFVIEKATKILNAEKCSLMLFDTDSQELIIRGAVGLAKETIVGTRVKLGDQIAGLVAQEGQPLFVNNIEKCGYPFSRKSRAAYKTKSFMCVPIKLSNKLVGVVNIADKRTEAGEPVVFDEVDLRILATIVRQAAIAIENATCYRELENFSVNDAMTGIFNYRYFVKALEREIQRVKRYEKSLCLLLMDIHDFKSYNDAFGHSEGDVLLKEVGRILKEKTRIVDIACRYAGDEFVVILPETEIANAQSIGEKIIKAVSELDLRQEIDVSVGIAGCYKDGDRHALIQKADQALKEAKKSGKNKVCCLP